MYAIDIFRARGHELIKANHKTTLEITKDDYLTKKGDCIIAINSEKACSDLKEDVKRLIRSDDSEIKITLECEGVKEVIKGHGSSKLILNDSRSIVIRKSSYVDQRTLAIMADKSASDVSRSFVEKVRNRNALIEIMIEVFV